MDWVQFIIFAGGVFGCFFWNRSESRADYRHMDCKLESFRAETSLMIKSIDSTLKAIQDEIKDFHHRLCKIEESKK